MRLLGMLRQRARRGKARHRAFFPLVAWIDGGLFPRSCSVGPALALLLTSGTYQWPALPSPKARSEGKRRGWHLPILGRGL
jgi:hypothetical protein